MFLSEQPWLEAAQQPCNCLKSANPYMTSACRLDELMPAGVRESLDVSKLERATEDLEYRDSVLRAEDRVCGRAHQPLTFPCVYAL